MSHDFEWVLLDTETSGLKAPIYALEIAAQKMKGIEPQGEPFRVLIDHGVEIPAQASRVNGLTKEILERDGEEPEEAYRQMRSYVEERPISAYNIAYDWDKVLVPEWKRLGIEPIGSKAFCFYEFTARMLDPIQCGNCKLQTLRQFYRLPERGAHSAMGDVLTAIDLLQKVIYPIAEKRKLSDISKWAKYCAEEWYPSRLTFGKFKGRHYKDAAEDEHFKQWLEWLSSSNNKRSQAMARWYLDKLSADDDDEDFLFAEKDFESSTAIPSSAEDSYQVMIFGEEQREYLKQMIESTREQLAHLEAEYTALKSHVDSFLSKIYYAIKDLRQERDNLKLRLEYRQLYLDELIRQGEESAKAQEQEYEEAKSQQQAKEQELDNSMQGKHTLSADEQKEFKDIYRKLMTLYHPDKFREDEEKREQYEHLSRLINDAKKNSDIKKLREIANYPERFLEGSLNMSDFSAETDIHRLKRLLETLRAETISIIDQTNKLKESPDYEMALMCEAKPEVLDQVIEKQKEGLRSEIKEMEDQVSQLGQEIEELTGNDFKSI